MTDTDARRAAHDVEKAQDEMCAFLEQTGRKRSAYREQPRFTDGL